MVLRDSDGRVHGVGAFRGVDTFHSQFVLFRPGRQRRSSTSRSAPRPPGSSTAACWSRSTSPGTRGRGCASPTDSIVSYDLAEWKRDPNAARPSLVWAPGPRQTLSGITTTHGKLLVSILDNVRGRAFAMDYAGGRWRTTEIALPRNATIGLAAASDQDEQAMFSVTDYLTPSTLYHYDGATGALAVLKTSPARFDASRHVVEQLEATSRDGTSIPYFLIRPREMRRDGSTPTLLYGYGGFQVSQVPNYSGTMGRLWLEQGNAYVVANLRGGGEFGPEWHQTAQLANKQRTWDDYIAVAEDLIRRRITSPRRLGVVGGSQGGLLVGTAITQRPELFNAAIIQVPLFDMLRYHLIGAGASWIGEYGDPRIPEQRAWIAGYSPYQRLRAGVGPIRCRSSRPRPPTTGSTRPTAARPRPGSPSSARLIIITRISRAATPRRRICRRRRDGWRWNIPTRRGGWWTESFEWTVTLGSTRSGDCHLFLDQPSRFSADAA